MIRMNKSLSKDLDLVHKERSNTAEATDNSVNKEPKMLTGGLDAPSINCLPNTRHRIRVPGLVKESR